MDEISFMLNEVLRLMPELEPEPEIEEEEEKERPQNEFEERLEFLANRLSIALKEAAPNAFITGPNHNFSLFSYDINDTEGFCKSISRTKDSYNEACRNERKQPAARQEKPPMAPKFKPKEACHNEGKQPAARQEKPPMAPKFKPKEACRNELKQPAPRQGKPPMAPKFKPRQGPK